MKTQIKDYVNNCKLVSKLTEEKDHLMERLMRQLYNKKVKEKRHQQEKSNRLVKEQEAQMDSE